MIRETALSHFERPHECSYVTVNVTSTATHLNSITKERTLTPLTENTIQLLSSIINISDGSSGFIRRTAASLEMILLHESGLCV